MSRYDSRPAYSFTCKPLSHGDYMIAWTVDFYYEGDRLRYPRRFRRVTDEKGAKRFCKKHDLNLIFV